MNPSVLFSNRLINVGVLSWAAAQFLKTMIDLVRHKRFDKGRLAGAGGMPSSHSSVTASVVLTSYYLYGFQSSAFAVSFILALIVMYDAAGVRWSAGLHAQAINRIIEYLAAQDKNHPLREEIPKLNESIGHRRAEVLCGALLGILIAAAAQALSS